MDSYRILGYSLALQNSQRHWQVSPFGPGIGSDAAGFVPEDGQRTWDAERGGGKSADEGRAHKGVIKLEDFTSTTKDLSPVM